jgi:hypothetical protein
MNGDRFRVMYIDEAIKAGYLDKWWNRHDAFFYVLLDFQDPQKPVLVATDIVANKWIVPLLNQLAEKA